MRYLYRYPFLLILCACSSGRLPYTCYDVNPDTNFCMLDDQATKMETLNIKPDTIYDYANNNGYLVSVKNLNTGGVYYECVRNSWSFRGDLMDSLLDPIIGPVLSCPITSMFGPRLCKMTEDGYCKSYYDNPLRNSNMELIKTDKNEVIASGEVVTKYHNEKEHAKAVKEEAEKEQKKINALQKKYGYKFCPISDLMYYMVNNQQVPKDCMVSSGGLGIQVLQQTTEGTLIRFPHYSVSTIMFVEKNNKVSQLVDDQRFSGYFVGSGTYKYTNVMGATQTVSKIKFLGYWEE